MPPPSACRPLAVTAALACIAWFAPDAGAATAPTLSLAVTQLSPTNHKMVDVGLTVANARSWWIAGVFQDEPVESIGDGNHEPDASACGCRKQLKLRAERQGGEDGRVYLINVYAYDTAGQLHLLRATVTVSHDNSKASKAEVQTEADGYRTNPNSMSPAYNSFGAGGIGGAG